MRDHASENLAELLRQFMDEPSARAAQQDLEAVERMLKTHPAPAPPPATVSRIRNLTVAAAHRRHRRIRVFRGTVAAAAAVVVTVLIGQFGRSPTGGPGVHFASIIPTAVWESHDLAADDVDLVYFAAEIQQIEAQMRAIEQGEPEIRGDNALDELEMELIALETEFWKG